MAAYNYNTNDKLYNKQKIIKKQNKKQTKKYSAVCAQSGARCADNTISINKINNR